MGIIRKQSIYSSIFIYIGFAIGAVNILILFPKYFTTEQFGLTRLLLDVSLLFSTVSTFATVPVTYKFYPFYNSYLPRKKNDLPFLTSLAATIGCFLLLTLITIFKDYIVRKFGERSPLFVTHYALLYPLTISLTFFSLFEAYAWSLHKTILTNFLREVVFRIIVLLVMLMYAFNFFSFETFLSLYSLVYLPSALILLFFLIKSGKFPINFSISDVTKRLYRKIVSFGLFIFSGSVLNVMSRTIDLIIISSQSAGGLSDAGVFAIATYMIQIMEVPQRSIVAIAIPIISQAWKDRNMKQISELYKKTSLNLLIFGLAIWGALLLNMDNAISFLGPAYEPAKMIVIIMGTAKIIDLGTGLNSQILLLSKYWRIDFITNMLFVLISIPLNYTLINHYGVIGSAFANLIALTVFNSIRFFYIWKLYKMQPLTVQTIYALLIALICFGVTAIIPSFPNLFIDVAVKAIVYVGLFGSAILFFKVSEDLNGLFTQTVQRLKSR